jgi:hypothetical protein
MNSAELWRMARERFAAPKFDMVGWSEGGPGAPFPTKFASFDFHSLQWAKGWRKSDRRRKANDRVVN